MPGPADADWLRLRGNICPRAGPALARASGEVRAESQDWTRLCLRFVRIMLGVGLDTDGDGARAIDAWTAVAPLERHGFYSSPAGVPFFWAGHPGTAGHVALCDGRGGVYSTDILALGHVSHVPLGLIAARWGLHPLGWTEQLNDVVVFAPGPIPTAA